MTFFHVSTTPFDRVRTIFGKIYRILTELLPYKLVYRSSMIDCRKTDVR